MDAIAVICEQSGWYGPVHVEMVPTRHLQILHGPTPPSIGCCCVVENGCLYCLFDRAFKHTTQGAFQDVLLDLIRETLVRQNGRVPPGFNATGKPAGFVTHIEAFQIACGKSGGSFLGDLYSRGVPGFGNCFWESAADLVNRVPTAGDSRGCLASGLALRRCYTTFLNSPLGLEVYNRLRGRNEIKKTIQQLRDDMTSESTWADRDHIMMTSVYLQDHHEISIRLFFLDTSTCEFVVSSAVAPRAHCSMPPHGRETWIGVIAWNSRVHFEPVTLIHRDSSYMARIKQLFDISC